MKRNIIVAVLGCLFCTSLTSFTEEMQRKDVGLTIYNQNFALVRDVRNINLKEGLNEVRFFDIAEMIEPTSVHFMSITAPDKCWVLEQHFEFDLVSADKLLSKYIDNVISIITQGDVKYTGYLASYDGVQIILAKDRTKGPIFMINRDNVRSIEFPQLPGGLTTKPTLVWTILNNKQGIHTVEVSYITGGINWVADYIAVVSDDQKHISLTGWVTIDNRSGTSYENATLKLIAGDVARVRRREVIPSVVMDMPMRALAAPAPEQFEERQLFEYHLYELQRKTTLKNNQIKQISLLTAPKVSVNKVYTYRGQLHNRYHFGNWRELQYNRKVAVNLEFKNNEENGLGIPLPEGIIKVYKADVDKSLQFIGENRIDHTPKNEKISLFVGNAFDIVGERKITDHNRLAVNLYRDSYEITLRNHKKEPVIIRVIERQWGDWRVLQSSHEYIKEDAATIVFEVNVPANGETKITYTAEYRF